MATRDTLLQPNPLDAREMEIFSQVPPADQQAWLAFVRSSHDREAIGIRPAYTFDQFDKGLAGQIPDILPMVDAVVAKGIGGTAIIPNYYEPSTVQLLGHNMIVDPVIGSFDTSKKVN